MNFKLSLLATALIASFAAHPVAAQTAKKPTAASSAVVSSKTPLVTVNGTPISTGMADLMIGEQIAQGQANSPELRSAIREDLIKREVLAQEARKRGIDKTDQASSRFEIARQSILLGLYLDEYIKTNPISDAAVRAEYDKQIAIAGDKEYKVRHILTDKEEDAKAIITKLNGGGKFEELAKDSKDEASKGAGGDLGWGRTAEYTKEFAETVPKLEKGLYTRAPVKSSYGYHVILLEDTRKPDLPEFAAVSERVRQSLIQQAIQKHAADLVSRAKIQ